MATDDEIQQRVAWKMRISEYILKGEIDSDALLIMMEAAFIEAYLEGLRDAQKLCHEVGDEVTDLNQKRVCRVLEQSLQELETRNRAEFKETGDGD